MLHYKELTTRAASLEDMESNASDIEYLRSRVKKIKGVLQKNSYEKDNARNVHFGESSFQGKVASLVHEVQTIKTSF